MKPAGGKKGVELGGGKEYTEEGTKKMGPECACREVLAGSIDHA